MAFVRRQRLHGQILGLEFMKTGMRETDDEPPAFLFGEIPSLLSEMDEQPDMRKRHWLLESLGFKVAVGVLVATNTIVMGIEADHPEVQHVWDTFEHFFTCGFLVEMIVKLHVLGRDYFGSNSNRLDAFLVVAAILDLWIFSPIGIMSYMQTLSLLRWFRFLRLVRLAKVVAESRKLVLICESMMDTIKVTIYVGFLLFLTIYACAIFCVQTVGRHSEYPGYAEEIQEINEQEMMVNFNPHLCFGSLGAAMLTLFNIATTTEWSEIVRPISVVQPAMTIFFLVFMLTIGFGLMNVIVGMIVDNMLEQSEKMKRLDERENRLKRIRLVKRLHAFFESFDDDHNQHLTASEIESLLGNPDLQQLLRHAHLPAGCTCQEFMDLLDQSGDGVLTHSEFILSLYRLIDDDPFQHVSALHAGVNNIKLLLRQTASSIQNRLEALEARLDSNVVPPRGGAPAHRTKTVGDKEQAKEPAKDGPGVGVDPGSSSTPLPSISVDDAFGHDQNTSSAESLAWSAVLRKMTVTNLLTQSFCSWRYAVDMCKHQAFASRLHEDMQSSVTFSVQKLASQRLHVAKVLGKQAIMMQGSQMALHCWHAWRSSRVTSPRKRPRAAEHDEKVCEQARNRPRAAGHDQKTCEQVATTKQTHTQNSQPLESLALASTTTLAEPPATQCPPARATQNDSAHCKSTVASIVGTAMIFDRPVSPPSPAGALPSSSPAASQGSTGDSPLTWRGLSGDSPAALRGSAGEMPTQASSKEASGLTAASEASCAAEDRERESNEPQPRESGLKFEAKESAKEVTTFLPESGKGPHRVQSSPSRLAAQDAAIVTGAVNAAVAATAEMDSVVVDFGVLQPVRPAPHPLVDVIDADATCGGDIGIGLQTEATELAKRFARIVDAVAVDASAPRHDVDADAAEAGAHEIARRIVRVTAVSSSSSASANQVEFKSESEGLAALVSPRSCKVGREHTDESPTIDK